MARGAEAGFNTSNCNRHLEGQAIELSILPVCLAIFAVLEWSGEVS